LFIPLQCLVNKSGQAVGRGLGIPPNDLFVLVQDQTREVLDTKLVREGGKLVDIELREEDAVVL
jgi:hypothetical protein